MKPDYTALDAAIIEAIRTGHFTLGLIEPVVADQVTAGLRGPKRNLPDWEVVSRRMTSLRRAGKIRYETTGTKGWVLEKTDG